SYPWALASARTVSSASRLAWMSVRTRYRIGGGEGGALIVLRLEPVNQLIDQRLDAGAPRLEAEVGLLVRRTSGVEEPLEVGAIARERTPAVLRNTRNHPLERRIQPDRGAVAFDDCTVLWVHERPAAGCDDRVPERNLVREHGAFDTAKVWLTVLREDVRDWQALALLDQLVDVGEPPVEPLRQRASDAALAGAHEADQVHLVCLHAALLTRRDGPACRRIRDKKSPPNRRRRSATATVPPAPQSRTPSPSGDRRGHPPGPRQPSSGRILRPRTRRA